MKRLLLACLLVAWTIDPRAHAQLRVAPVDLEQGHVALGLALRHLGNTGIFMMTTAHPDDENNGLLVMLNRGQGYRTALATATRGNGGQNEIGPELSEALGVLRTEELHAIHRFDGAEQYFTRAIDFGYSFSLDETYEKWGRDEIIGDYVRLIRTIRPDVMTALAPTGSGGGQHHQASALLAREAYRAAGDPRRYPEQIAEGLHPWRPRKFYFSANVGYGRGAGASGAGQLTVNIGGYDSLLGRTWSEVGAEARSMHKCQGTDQLLWLPGPASATYTLAESSVGSLTATESTLFDGVDTSIGGLAQLATPRAPAELTAGLEAIATAIQTAQTRFSTQTDGATVAPLLAGLRTAKALRAALAGMTISEGSRFDLDARLAQKEREFEDAVVMASRLRIEVLADDQVVVPGQPVRVTVLVANRGEQDLAVKRVSFEGFDGTATCAFAAVTAGRGRGAAPAPGPAVALASVPPGVAGQCAPALTIPLTARVTEPYWHRAGEAGRYRFDADAPFGLPYRPTPFRAILAVLIGGSDEVMVDLPVQARYQDDVFSGEKRGDLLVVPQVSVSVSPSIAIISTPRVRPTRSAPVDNERQIRVMLVNDTKGATDQVVTLETPAGWKVTPERQTVVFTREDESQTVRFRVVPPAGAPLGDVVIKAVVNTPTTTVSRGFQKIEYPHIRRQHVYREAETRVKIMDVKTTPYLTVGYVMGVGDEVPPAIAQLGVKVEMLDSDDLTWGDLSRFSTIVTGVRADERREDLRANNSRLLEYVRNGGTVIVQYNKFEFNNAQYGPYPAKVSTERATDEFAPVTPILASDAVFNVPNTLTGTTWANWVQERGLYFLGEKDARYRDLLSVDERIPNNAGAKLGALVDASYGKGRWVYVGLNLWRQLPAGVDGAYQLLANLLSLGH